MTSVATKVDTILVDGLKSPRPPRRDLRDHNAEINDRYEYHIRLLADDGPDDNSHIMTQIYAFERSVFELATVFAEMLNEDERITDLEFRSHNITELGFVTYEAEKLMQDMMRKDMTSMH